MGKLSGMTGFARRAGQAEWGQWAWEARSVNGRNLDVRVMLPSGLEDVEREIKALAQSRFVRGSITLGLRIELAAGTDAPVVNEALLRAIKDVAERVAGAPMSVEAIATLMAVKGVIETRAPMLREIVDQPDTRAILLRAAEQVIGELGAARDAEGAALRGVLEGVVGEMEGMAAQAKEFAATHPALMKERFNKQLHELDARQRIDVERLAGEVAIAVAKADVREELDRLAVHFSSARALLREGSPAGRKLDFLAQELNREANTLGTKSMSLELTQAGLSLKGVIDQFKEQAANVE